MISLRRAEDADAVRLTRICVDAFKLENVIVGRSPPDHDHVETHRRAIREIDVRVVMEYDRPVGSLSFSPHGRFGRDVFLEMFFIARDRQRRGVGRRAWRLAEAEMTSGTTVTLDTPAAGVGGRAFFRSLGFVERSESKPAFFGGGNLRLVRMTKRVHARRSRITASSNASPPPEPASSAEPASPS